MVMSAVTHRAALCVRHMGTYAPQMDRRRRAHFWGDLAEISAYKDGGHRWSGHQLFSTDLLDIIRRETPEAIRNMFKFVSVPPTIRSSLTTDNPYTNKHNLIVPNSPS